MAGRVVEHRVVPLRHGLVLGDGARAVVSFPGACLELQRDRRGWTLGGHRLVPGRNLALSLERCELRVHLVEADPLPHEIVGLPDPRLLVATLALLLMMGTVDAAARTVDAHPQVATALRAWMMGTPDLSGSERSGSQPTAGTGAEGDPPFRWRPAVELHAAPTE